MATKKIILIWDLDGAIGQINATYPYNFNFHQLPRELNNVRYALDKLDEYNIKTCFAVTGFSAEDGVFPYVFPDLINEIARKGHEIASHSWRHEWIPVFEKKQILKSLDRSKWILEKAISNRYPVAGFVPPHNRPMTWLSRGALSLGDRGLFPLFKNGDMGSLLAILKKTGYRWVRVSYRPLWKRRSPKHEVGAGRIVVKKDIMILENHYTGFDKNIVDHILNTQNPTYTISAHPLMLDFPNKRESKDNFESLLDRLLNSGQAIEFVRPMDILRQ